MTLRPPTTIQLDDDKADRVRRDHQDRIRELQLALQADEAELATLVAAPGGVPTTRLISTTAPLSGGGDLSADRTLAVSQFDSTHPGVVPLSGGGTANFLRADATWASPGGGIKAGLFGDGSDGSKTLDGSTTILGMAPSGNVYTAVRNLYFVDLVINSGVTLNPAGFYVFGQGTLSGAGNIARNGNAGSGASAGAALGTKLLPGGAAGGAGGAAPYGAPSNGSNSATAPFGSTAVGGAGGQSGFGPGGGGGGTAGTVTAQGAQFGDISSYEAAVNAWVIGYQGGTPALTTFTTGSGGGGGRGGFNNGGASNGGGGGGAGGWVVVRFFNITLTGKVTADGGAGANAGAASDGGGGGGGGGGVAIVVYSTGSVTATANGGAAGTGGPVADPGPGGLLTTGFAGSAGSAGFAKAFNV